MHTISTRLSFSMHTVSTRFSFSTTFYCLVINEHLSFLRFADCVSVKDEVLTVHENDELTPAKVINISTFNMQVTFIITIIYCYFQFSFFCLL